MMRNEDAAVKIPHGFVAAFEQVADLVHIGLAAEMAVGLVADLHHADVAAGIRDRRQHPACPLVDLAGQRVMIVRSPVFRALLLGRVRPEIGILDIHQQLHAVLRRTPADLAGSCHVVVAASVAVTIAVIGFIPDTHPDVVDIVVIEHLEQVRLVPGFVMENDPGFLDGDDGGNIHATNRLTVIDGGRKGAVDHILLVSVSRRQGRGLGKEQGGCGQHRSERLQAFHVGTSLMSEPDRYDLSKLLIWTQYIHKYSIPCFAHKSQ